MSTPVIGFIGFGEAGFHLSKGLREAGAGQILAYDIDPSDRVRNRAAESQVRLVQSSAEIADACTVLFSTVTASSALDAARQTAPYIRADRFYADLNSVSPAMKQSIGEAIPARFVEAAVMSPIPPYGHRSPMLLGGKDAAAFVELMKPFGMRLEVVSENIGTAAATKMCRSVIVKGLEALLCECVLGASRYGAKEKVFASLGETFPGIDWNKLADYMIGRALEHGARRAREMEEVAETLRSIGVDPFMAEATVKRMDGAAGQDARSLTTSRGL